jgi:eukaryotic-like serine/threonine-protein kinase
VPAPQPGNSGDVVDVLRELHPGDVVSERYRLERRLGSGATAAVWRARDRDLGRIVALKVLRGDEVVPELASRFQREATILGRLSHPNVVPVLATGNHEGRPYLVMELVEGEPLSQVLRKGPMPIDQAVDLVAAVASGLAAAHQAGVVHRDIKPANIVRGDGGVPRLVDFGIARADDLTQITSPDVVVGTAAYLSPEQARGELPGPASDIYSLGCVLYEALTGTAPFTGGSAVALAYRHVHELPQPPSARRPDLPAALDDVVCRCLEKDPARRHASADELAGDLRAALSAPAGEATTAGVPVVRDETLVMPAVSEQKDDLVDPSPLAPVEPPSRPWRMMLGAGAAALLLLLLLVAALDDQPDRARATTDSPSVTTSPPPTTATTAPPTTEKPDKDDDEGKDRKGHGKHGDGD